MAQNIDGTPETGFKFAGFNTPPEKQEIYVPAAVWCGRDVGGGGPTVSAEEALELGAITLNMADGTATWPQSFWE